MQIFGLDEVGRGSLAGPMLACSVPDTVLSLLPKSLKIKITDSKQTSPSLRYHFAQYFLSHHLPFHLSCITASELNTHGLAWAQKEIFERLIVPSSVHFIDGRFRLSSSYQQFSLNLTHADRFHPLVGLASILAKYFRDQYMAKLDSKYPHYSFIKNKGYGSLAHRQAVQKYGPCPEHRLTFIRKLTA